MNQLERRYRLALRLLPAEYRRQWADDMVAAFMMSMEDDDPERAEFLAEFGRPSWSEVASVAGLSLRLHLGLTGARSPRADARGDMVRIVVLLWLLAGAVWGVVAAGIQTWLLGAVAFMPDPPVEWAAAAPAGAWRIAMWFGGLAWLVAFLAILLGHPATARAATALGVITNAAAVGEAVVAELRHRPALTLSSVVLLAVDLALLAALWTVARPWPPVRRTPWLLALLVGVDLVAALAVGAFAGVVPWWVLDPTNIGAVVVLALVLVRLTAGVSPPWSLALAVLAWGMVTVRLVTLLDVVRYMPGQGSVAMTVAMGELVALLAAAVASTLVAARLQTRLPTTT